MVEIIEDSPLLKHLRELDDYLHKDYFDERKRRYYCPPLILKPEVYEELKKISLDYRDEE